MEIDFAIPPIYMCKKNVKEANIPVRTPLALQKRSGRGLFVRLWMDIKKEIPSGNKPDGPDAPCVPKRAVLALVGQRGSLDVGRER